MIPPEFRVEEDLVVGIEPAVPLEPPLLDSVLLSVLKLALERLRMSFKKEGAIVHLNECQDLRVQVDSVSCGIAPAKVKEVEVEGKGGEDWQGGGRTCRYCQCKLISARISDDDFDCKRRESGLFVQGLETGKLNGKITSRTYMQE